MTAILVLDQSAIKLAKVIKGTVANARIYGLVNRVKGADESFRETVSQLQSLYQSGEHIIGLCATGILVRALAPVLNDKKTEPAVLAVAVDGSVVVPLLGGHNGANVLATQIAKKIEGIEAITTSSDIRFGVAIDDPPKGWKVLNRDAAKNIYSRILAGDPIRLNVKSGDVKWLTQSEIQFDDCAEGPCIQVTPEFIAEPKNDLVLCPPVLSLGVGCERNCDPAELEELIRKTFKDTGLSTGSISCIASLDLKMDESAVNQLAASLGVPVRFFTAEELDELTPYLANPSDTVFNAVGCHGVSEGSALAAAGSNARLLVEKQRSLRATCAIAINPDGIKADQVGQGRGHLSIIGIGPGSDSWRTPEATALLSAASDFVGYGLYLDLIEDFIVGKHRHISELAQEEERVRRALDLASEGRNVALVCSGDAGIYALATLVFELIDRENQTDWNRVSIQVAPGISALQAAASRIGAPIGHDFCTISLSDLLTPFEEIERRIKAAAEGDFVVAFYNPVSKRRRTQLVRAKEILLSGRGPDVPVVLARNLGREEESIEVIKLADLKPDHADMLTMVLVGNSQSRSIERGGRHWVYTPRGYAVKMI